MSLPEQSFAARHEATARNSVRTGLAPPLQAAWFVQKRREDAMKRETTSSSSQLFRSSRRWSPIPFILSGILLVAGYVGASAVLIDNYSNHTAQVGGPRA